MRAARLVVAMAAPLARAASVYDDDDLEEDVGQGMYLLIALAAAIVVVMPGSRAALAFAPPRRGRVMEEGGAGTPTPQKSARAALASPTRERRSAAIVARAIHAAPAASPRRVGLAAASPRPVGLAAASPRPVGL